MSDLLLVALAVWAIGAAALALTYGAWLSRLPKREQWRWSLLDQKPAAVHILTWPFWLLRFLALLAIVAVLGDDL